MTRVSCVAHAVDAHLYSHAIRQRRPIKRWSVLCIHHKQSVREDLEVTGNGGLCTYARPTRRIVSRQHTYAPTHFSSDARTRLKTRPKRGPVLQSSGEGPKCRTAARADAAVRLQCLHVDTRLNRTAAGDACHFSMRMGVENQVEMTGIPLSFPSETARNRGLSHLRPIENHKKSQANDSPTPSTSSPRSARVAPAAS